MFELTPPEHRDELTDMSKSSDYGYISHEAYVQRVSEMTEKTTDEIEEIMRADHVRNEPLVAYVRSLHPQYKVGLLSNVGRGVMSQLFSSEEQRELFDVVVLSSDVGMVKPQPEIYQLVAKQLGVSSEECLMIDDLAVNIDGAEAVGMKGVVFTTTENATAVIQTMLSDAN